MTYTCGWPAWPGLVWLTILFQFNFVAINVIILILIIIINIIWLRLPNRSAALFMV